MSYKQNFTLVPFLVTILSAFSLYLMNPVAYDIVFGLEGLAEWLQFGSYFLAGSIFLISGFQFAQKEHGLGKYIPLIFGFFVLVTALEEISWGQKVFNFTTPDAISQINTQGELTMHNLESLQPLLHRAYILSGVLLASLTFFRDRKIMKLFKPELSDFLPPVRLVPYFISTSLFYFSLDYINPLLGGVIGNHQEVFETLFSFGILLWSLSLRISKESKKS